ncbi:MAG: hypothetical protein ABIU63_08555 [Chitinophagaceae bacterium]
MVKLPSLQNRFIVIFSFLLISLVVQSQKKTILIEPVKRKINQDALLPAQTYVNLQIPTATATAIIEVNISHGRKMGSSPEKIAWVRPVSYSGDFAELPIDMKFKSNSNYSFEVTLYNYMNATQKLRLRSLLLGYINSYLDAIVSTGNEKINLLQKNDQIMKDLNEIVSNGLRDYKNFRNKQFQGFSGIVKLKLQQVSAAKLSDASHNLGKEASDSIMTDEKMKNAYTQKLILETKNVVNAELNNYLDDDFVELYDHFIVANQYTEKTQTVLPLFIGYGAVYFGGNVHDLDYDTKPYAGFSIPLGKGDGKYFSRTTFIMGVFINNFKNAADSTITGPLVDRPIFAGLGFRLYDFINFNAGMVATSTTKQNLANIKTEDIKLRPFIGLNFQFNLWLGVNKK